MSEWRTVWLWHHPGAWMSSGLAKDLIVGLVGVLLLFALELSKDRLVGAVNADLISLVCVMLAVVLPSGYLIFRHYHHILCTEGHARGRHTAYDELRQSLGSGGTPARLYAQFLERALHAVERLFGEREITDRSFFQRVIGLSRPVPLWSAPALDRCVLFAFLCPQLLLFLGWALSGHAGPAEKVLALISEDNPLLRYLAVGTLTTGVVAYANCHRIADPGNAVRHETKTIRWTRFSLWLVVLGISCLITDRLLNHGSATVGGAAIMASSVVGAVAGDVLIAVFSGFFGVAVGSLVVLYIGTLSAGTATAFACALVGFVGSAFGGKGSAWSRLRQRLHFSLLFWWLFLVAGIVTYICLARLLSRSGAWPAVGPILLFYGLLPALNAPFLWFSVGLTRCLLWLGLERKSWWPYFYALVDAAMAVLVIVLLVIVMVVGIQTLNLMAMKGSGRPILPVVPLLNAVFDSLRKRALDPEYWWVYTLLLSSMIPSLVNLAIGGFSLLRGIPTVSRYLYRRLPKGHMVVAADRNWISLVLASQAMAGMCLGLASQFIFLPWFIFGYLLPVMGFGVLRFAFSVAAFNLPGRIFGGL
ncbi:MAG TPA: hypothetical protein VH189_14590 [Rhizomicrobium sp.]|nr:hypothetical protein [Rhizomicrobium sp.]